MRDAVAGHTDLYQRGVCGLAAAVSGGLLSRCTPAGFDPRWIFLASIVVFGLVHGACDLWLPGWVLGRAATGRFLAGFCLGYLGLAGAVLLLWRWQPGLALAGFLLLTAWHWGSADAVLTASRSWRFGLLAWGRGLMVIAAPSAFHPQAAWQVLAPLAAGAVPALPPDHFQTVALVILSMGVGMQLVIWPLRSPGSGASGHHLETLFLLALFAAFDPLTSTALYFIWFHAWRHLLRLCRWQSPGERSRWISLARFHLAALPCALGALLLLWLVARTWPGDLLRAYLVLLSAVTLPHAMLVLWLDRLEARPVTPMSTRPPQLNVTEQI